jgi:hypothetical protein
MDSYRLMLLSAKTKHLMRLFVVGVAAKTIDFFGGNMRGSSCRSLWVQYMAKECMQLFKDNIHFITNLSLTGVSFFAPRYPRLPSLSEIFVLRLIACLGLLKERAE